MVLLKRHSGPVFPKGKRPSVFFFDGCRGGVGVISRPGCLKRKREAGESWAIRQLCPLNYNFWGSRSQKALEGGRRTDVKPGCRGSRAPRALQQKGPGYLGYCHSGNGLFHSTNAGIRTSAPPSPPLETRLRPDRQGHFGFVLSLGVQLVVTIFLNVTVTTQQYYQWILVAMWSGLSIVQKTWPIWILNTGFNTGSLLHRCSIFIFFLIHIKDMQPHFINEVCVFTRAVLIR